MTYFVPVPMYFFSHALTVSCHGTLLRRSVRFRPKADIVVRASYARRHEQSLSSGQGNRPGSESGIATLKGKFAALNLAAISFAAFWAFASHQIDGFNVGGQIGDVDFWMQMRDIGCYGSLCLWIICIAVSIEAVISRRFTLWTERICWNLLALFGAPLVFFSLALYLNPNVNLVT